VSSGQSAEHYLTRSKTHKFLRDYPGPAFSTLDEVLALLHRAFQRLQAGFRNYLMSFGIDSKMAAMIEAASMDKE
jgi:hypothetical protein